jgi:hypothetical protein
LTNRDATRRRAVPLPSAIKNALRERRAVQSLWTAYRSRQVLAEYRARREHYARLAAERDLVYSFEGTVKEVRARLAARGYSPAPREIGEIHTFAAFPTYGWHKHLLPDLKELGPVTHFDYQALGYDAEVLAAGTARAAALRDEMLARIMPALRAAHQRRAVDWAFFYGGGQDVSPPVVHQIVSEFGIPVVNLSLDDKQGWAGASAGQWRTGAVDITREFDLFATSARVACEWHMAEGGRPLYLPEGFDATTYAPARTDRDLEVSFVGGAYGFRRSMIDYLRRHGVNVATFGAGWPGGPVANAVDVFNRSKINLGTGGIEYAEELTNVKGRDFEIPGTGGGMYLTSFNPDLAQHFVIGEEIVCYGSRDEMLELIRHYLRRPDEIGAIARRGRARCLRQHRWLHRYETLLQVLGITLGGNQA